MRIAFVSMAVAAVCLMACWQPAEQFTPLEPRADQKEITSFGFLSGANPVLGSDVNATVSGIAVTATVPFGTNVGALIATFVTTGASVTVDGVLQTSGVTANDFAGPVTYLITAENGSSTTYTVSVIVAPSPAKEITEFAFLMADNSALSGDVTATITGTAIAATVPFGTNVTGLKATFQTTGSSVAIGSVIQNSGVTVNNFTTPLTYVVTAADGSTKPFTVTVTIAADTAKELTSFAFLVANNSVLTADVTATIAGTAISVTVPYGTNVTALKATFQITGASVAVSSVLQTSGVTANNFTNPATYTVSAANGSMKMFTVTVTIAANPAKEITSFAFLVANNSALAADVTATIAGTAISATVPFGTNVSALKATFQATGASVAVSGVTQTSGVTANNFTSSVSYTVTAADTSTKIFTVAVTIAANPAKEITSFAFLVANNPALAADVTATVAGTAISATVPFGTSVTALKATFQTTGASVAVSGVTQTSGVTANNFSSSVAYTVTAADASTKIFTVTVTIAANPAKEITSFAFLAATNSALAADVTATIAGTAISATVPFGTNVTALKATFQTTGASVAISGVTQTSGVTANNFTSSVAYTVTAADASTKVFTVTVTIAGNPAKDITSFAFLATNNPALTADVTGAIAGTAISVVVPFGTNVSALKATFQTTGASVAVAGVTQTSGVTANNFTSAVTYTVTASDNSMKSYTVTVTFSATVVHTTVADFQTGTWANLGSLVTGSGGGAVQLATGGAELLAGSKLTTLLGRQVSAAVAIWNGRVYVAGGYGPLPGSQPVATVRSAAVNADGTVSAWRVETSMPDAMRDQEMVAWNGRLYVAGGYNTSASNKVYSTKVNADGTLAPWDTDTPLPTSRNGVPLVAWGNRIYAVSGSLNASNVDGVVTSAPLDGTGRVGAWRTETTLPGGTAWRAIAYDGRIYSLGGASNADDTALIYSVAIGADGVLGAWRAETPYPVSRNSAGIGVWGGRIYAAGGRIGGVAAGTVTGTIISSAIAADGTLSAWRTESVAVPNGVGFFQAAAWDGTLVMVASDDVGSVWTYPINSAGTLGSSWTQTLLPSERDGHDTFAFGGTLFAAGGRTGTTGTADSSVIGAPLAADGSVGVWATSATPWFTSGGGHRGPAAIINSRIYAFKNAGGPGNQAFGYNTVSSAGVGATWTGSAWPWGGTWIDEHDVVALGTRLYVIGGEDWGCGVHAEVLHAAVATDGSVGSWTATTSLPAGRYKGGGATWNGFVYHVAGRTTGCPNPPVPVSATVYYAKAATDGSLGAWTTATASLPAAIQDVAGVEAWDGVLYVIGGTDGNQATSRTTVYTAKINADGSLQTWSTGTALPAGRSKLYGNNFVTKWHGKLHVVGGFDYASPQGGRNTVWTSGVESYAARGSYVNVMDFGADRTLQSFAWTASSGGVVTAYISMASSTGAFSDWAAVTSGATLSLANVRYLRYRFDLAPDVGGLAPTVFDVTASLAP